MRWALSHRAEAGANQIAKRHYTCQTPDSPQFVPPGSCLVLRAAEGTALWVTSAPFAEYVRHAWAGAWVNSLFRREGSSAERRRTPASVLIREAVAVTRWRWPAVPALGMVTFVDTEKVRAKSDPGYCYMRAGFPPAAVREMRRARARTSSTRDMRGLRWRWLRAHRQRSSGVANVGTGNAPTRDAYWRDRELDVVSTPLPK